LFCGAKKREHFFVGLESFTVLVDTAFFIYQYIKMDQTQETPDIRLSKKQKIDMGITVKRPQTEAQRLRNAAASVRMKEMHKRKNDMEKQYEADRFTAFQNEYKNRTTKADSRENAECERPATPVGRTARETAYANDHPVLPKTVPLHAHKYEDPAPKKAKAVKKAPKFEAKQSRHFVKVTPEPDDSSSSESEYIQKKKKKALKTIQDIQHLDHALHQARATARVNPFTAMFNR
jgi:hypothetical protein